jgi:hypothetical protein
MTNRRCIGTCPGTRHRHSILTFFGQLWYTCPGR